MQLPVFVGSIDVLSCSAGPRGLCLGCDCQFLIQVELISSFVLFFIECRLLGCSATIAVFASLYTYFFFWSWIFYFTLNYFIHRKSDYNIALQRLCSVRYFFIFNSIAIYLVTDIIINLSRAVTLIAGFYFAVVNEDNWCWYFITPPTVFTLEISFCPCRWPCCVSLVDFSSQIYNVRCYIPEGITCWFGF